MACGSEEPEHEPSGLPEALIGTTDAAAANGDVSAIRAHLATGNSARSRNACGDTLLHVACAHGQLDASRALLDAGVPIHFSGAHDWTPMHSAAMGGHWFAAGSGARREYVAALGTQHVEVVRLLLERGAQHHAEAKRGESPLHLAGLHSNEPVARLLLDRGADVMAVDSGGHTPLHFAARGGALALVKLLIARGADVRAVAESGVTALHETGREGAEEYLLNPDAHEARASIAELLLAEGADPNAPSSKGTPIAVAVACGADDVLAVLLKNGGRAAASRRAQDESRPPIHSAASTGDVAVLQTLLDAGAGTEERDKFGRTALHLAAVWNRIEVVDCLLRNKADVQAVDSSGAKPIHQAAWTGSLAMVKLLVAHGADVVELDANGNSTLHYVAQSGMGDAKLLDYLLDRGVKLDLLNSEGESALYAAERADSLVGRGVEKELRRRGAKSIGRR